jgi:Ca2+-binding EF-hand superfamily protein
MRCPPWLLRGLAALPALGSPADDVKNPGPTNRPDPAGTGPIMVQLRHLFAAWDTNKDGFLDKDELARAFRGARARPFDPRTDGNGKANARPSRSKYPDYHFLAEVDQNGDGKVSRDEFNTWARDYAVSLKAGLDAEKHIQALEARLETMLSTEERRQIEAELRRERDAQKQAAKLMKAYEKHLQQELKALQKQPAHQAKGKHGH